MTLQDILLKLARAAIEESFGKPFSFSKKILMEQFPDQVFSLRTRMPC